MFHVFKLAKIKMPLKCDYTFLVAFLFRIFPRVFKNYGNKLAGKTLTPGNTLHSI